MQYFVNSHIISRCNCVLIVNECAQDNQGIGISDLVEAPAIFEEVISNTLWVKEALNRRVSSRVFTAVLCFDAFSTTYMTIMYYIIAKSFLEGSDFSENYIHHLIAMFILVIYFSFREIVQIAHTIGKGNMLHYDLWNIVDFLRIVTVSFSIYDFFTITNLEDIDDDSSSILGFMTIHELIVITVVSMSLAVFKELKNLFLNFAKFVNSVEQVCKRLTSFIVALFIILVTFAVSFHFYFTGRGLCGDQYMSRSVVTSKNEAPSSEFCDENWMVFKMYYFILNPEIKSSENETRLIKLLYVFCTFIVVIVLLNVLIGIICSSYDESMKNGEIAFWINRLKLIDEIDGIQEMLKNGFNTIKTKLCLKISERELPSLNHRPEHVGQVETMWDLFTIAFEDMRFNQKRRKAIIHKLETTGMQIFIEDKMRSKDSRPVITCVVGLVVIPLWFIFGLGTLGIMWPLQVRAAIFCPKIIVTSMESPLESFSISVMRTVPDQKEKKAGSISSKVSLGLTREEDLITKINSLEAETRNIQETVEGLRKDISFLIDIIKEK